MRDAPAGLVGAFAANRPYLSIGVLAPGLIALAVGGARQTGEDTGAVIASFASLSGLALVAPMALAAVSPRDGFQRLLFFILSAVLVAMLYAADAGWVNNPFGLAPPRHLLLAGFGLFSFLLALSPLSHNISRLGVLTPFAALLGAAGACGYLAMEGLLTGPEGAMATALGLTLGVGAGVNVAADFAKIFAAGAGRKRAAAAAGHGAVAPSAFALMIIAIFFTLHSFTVNFGAVDWGVVWAGVTIAAASTLTALVAVTGGLSLSRINEQAAADENRRAVWFRKRWRPLRMALPPTTATAVVAIAGIFVVIAVFEAGFSDPVRFCIFIALVWAAAAIAFVSVRTSALIALLLTVGAIIADYAVAVLGVTAPSPGERLAALTLTAAALGAMTVSWRDAGEQWRNARDVVENALGDGLRRFLFTVGAGAASFFVAMNVFAWDGGVSAIIYFLLASLTALALAPAAMTAMSARIPF